MSKINGRTLRIEVAEVDYRGRRRQPKANFAEVSTKLSQWLKDRGLMHGVRETNQKFGSTK